MITAMQTMLELAYKGAGNGDLAADIAEWLEVGASWRDISRNVEKRCNGLRVSHESLRTWYGKKNAA